MDYAQSVEKILQRIHLEDQEGEKRPQQSLEKVKIGKVKTWIVEKAKDMSINIEGYYHEVSNYFIRHVLKSHGDKKNV